MYKIIYDDIIIDVVENLKYARYLKKSKQTIVTEETSANCIIGSNNQDRYHLKGLPYPDGSNLKTVSVAKIDEKEYKQLLKSLTNIDNSLINCGIRCIKRNKINELSDTCHSKIIDGINIRLNDNYFHHFKFALEDQINLLEIKQLIDCGQTSFMYHETGGINKEYTADDMLKIISKLFEHKQKHLKYFNELKYKVNQLNTLDEISNISYELK